MQTEQSKVLMLPRFLSITRKVTTMTQSFMATLSRGAALHPDPEQVKGHTVPQGEQNFESWCFLWSFWVSSGPRRPAFGVPRKKHPHGIQKAQQGRPRFRAPSCPHHIELPPDAGPLPERGGDFLDEREVTRDDCLMLPGGEGGKDS